MWQYIAMVLGLVFGFGTGASGLSSLSPAGSVPITPYQYNACYNPEQDVTVTLKWPDNFTNLADMRSVENPKNFGAVTLQNPFNANPQCEAVLLNNVEGTPAPEKTRTYIRVRRGVRIPSCKTDELAGSYVTDSDSCPGPSKSSALLLRGSCDVGGYSDLRKVAEVKNPDGVIQQIFWVPFSHNVGCDYQVNSNCGPGDRTNLNLREFIYVLTKRDGFDPANTANCDVMWDSGAKSQKACSHYFDVYMAKDLWDKLQTFSDVAPTDPYYDTYQFYKKALLNCQEQSAFSPIGVMPGLGFPPYFLEKPFIPDPGNPPAQTSGKIIPSAPVEVNNYRYFIQTGVNVVKANLYQIPETEGSLNPCQPNMTSAISTPTPTPVAIPSCHAPLGTIDLINDANQTVTFRVYGRYDATQTFFFQQDQSQPGADPTVYQYMVTYDKPEAGPSPHQSLQLGSLIFSSGNEWTWATPFCKPAIYLYPEKETAMNVKVNVAGVLTKTIPPYDPVNGWKVIASPNGTLKLTTYNLQPTTYPYLFYEADLQGITIPKEGYAVAQEELPVRISAILKDLSFNEKETADFLAYWLPQLKEKPYYFVTLLSPEMVEDKERLSFSINPDTILRVRFVFEGLDVPIFVAPPAKYPKVERRGFVVADWGGTIVGKSCSEVTVK